MAAQLFVVFHRPGRASAVDRRGPAATRSSAPSSRHLGSWGVERWIHSQTLGRTVGPSFRRWDWGGFRGSSHTFWGGTWSSRETKTRKQLKLLEVNGRKTSGCEWRCRMLLTRWAGPAGFSLLFGQDVEPPSTKPPAGEENL